MRHLTFLSAERGREGTFSEPRFTHGMTEALSDGEECSLLEATGDKIQISCFPAQPPGHRRALVK